MDAGLIRPMLFPAARHLREICRSADYRFFLLLQCRLGRLARLQPGSFRYRGLAVRYADAASLLSAWREIFVRGIYDVRPNGAAPYLLDCGANVGLASLRFRTRFGRCQGAAFEPDPALADILEQNLLGWGCEMTVVRAAVAGQGSPRRFLPDGADAGKLVAGSEAAPGALHVDGVPLASYLDRPVDLLKLDVEGAELEALQAARGRLASVRHLFLEAHSFENRPQEYGAVLALLQAEGFRCYLDAPALPNSPFLRRRPPYRGIDFAVNVFATRDGAL